MAAQAQKLEAPTGFFARIGAYYDNVKLEMSKVTWPTRDQVKHYTRVVIIATIVIAVVLGVFDRMLSGGLKLLLDNVLS